MKRTLFLPISLLLAACGTAPAPDARKDAVDPAITAALADPIMADPQLDRRANRDVLRPDDDPFRAIIPPGSPQVMRPTGTVTLANRMETAMKNSGSGFAGCTPVRYSYRWAADLPKELALPSEARVAEAAGSDAAACRLRLIAFASTQTPEAVLNRYREVARSNGYRQSQSAVDGVTTIMAQRDDGAVFVGSVSAGDGGSVVDLATNRGR